MSSQPSVALPEQTAELQSSDSEPSSKRQSALQGDSLERHIAYNGLWQKGTAGVHRRWRHVRNPELYLQKMYFQQYSVLTKAQNTQEITEELQFRSCITIDESNRQMVLGRGVLHRVLHKEYFLQVKKFLAVQLQVSKGQGTLPGWGPFNYYF